jgi:hypothetical protein
MAAKTKKKFKRLTDWIKKNFSPPDDWLSRQPRNIMFPRNLNRPATRNSIVKQREIWIVQQQQKGEMTMKVSIITLATVFVLSSPFAMAQSSGYSSGVSTATRSAMNSMPARHSQDRGQRAASNGHGISRLGVTTNSGRLYNGG